MRKVTVNKDNDLKYLSGLDYIPGGKSIPLDNNTDLSEKKEDDEDDVQLQYFTE